jgi:hypothetical protein
MKELSMLRDWQAMYQQIALQFAGSAEGDEALRESKRYGMAADAIERLDNEVRSLLEDKKRLDSRQLVTFERDEFGEVYEVWRCNFDLRRAIDLGMEKQTMRLDKVTSNASGNQPQPRR